MRVTNICIFTLMLSAFALSAPDEPPPSEIYALQFRDGHTEGSWVLVLDNGIKYEVAFAEGSNRKAVEALASLEPQIISLNTSPEHNIYLVGYLDKPDAASLPQGQMPKAQLRLDGWYLKAPFYVPSADDPDGPIEVSKYLNPRHFLPAGERNDSEATRKLRASLEIHHDERLNLFWIGVESPFTKFLSKSVRKPKLQK